jgi:hypothetical protein
MCTCPTLCPTLWTRPTLCPRLWTCATLCPRLWTCLTQQTRPTWTTRLARLVCRHARWATSPLLHTPRVASDVAQLPPANKCTRQVPVHMSCSAVFCAANSAAQSRGCTARFAYLTCACATSACTMSACTTSAGALARHVWYFPAAVEYYGSGVSSYWPCTFGSCHRPCALGAATRQTSMMDYLPPRNVYSCRAVHGTRVTVSFRTVHVGRSDPLLAVRLAAAGMRRTVPQGRTCIRCTRPTPAQAALPYCVAGAFSQA